MIADLWPEWLRKRSNELSNGCIAWTGYIAKDGYGRFTVRGKWVYPHRVAYESIHGPIPAGFQMDHLCRMRSCINPEHLRPVIQKENILCGEGIAAKNAAKTHCKNGHPLFGPNLRLQAHGKKYVSRVCRKCNVDNCRIYWLKNKEASAHVS